MTGDRVGRGSVRVSSSCFSLNPLRFPTVFLLLNFYCAYVRNVQKQVVFRFLFTALLNRFDELCSMTMTLSTL